MRKSEEENAAKDRAKISKNPSSNDLLRKMKLEDNRNNQSFKKLTINDIEDI